MKRFLIILLSFCLINVAFGQSIFNQNGAFKKRMDERGHRNNSAISFKKTNKYANDSLADVSVQEVEAKPAKTRNYKVYTEKKSTTTGETTYTSTSNKGLLGRIKRNQREGRYKVYSTKEKATAKQTKTATTKVQQTVTRANTATPVVATKPAATVTTKPATAVSSKPATTVIAKPATTTKAVVTTKPAAARRVSAGPRWAVDVKSGVQYTIPRFDCEYDGSRSLGFSVTPRYDINRFFSAGVGFNFYKNQIEIFDTDIMSGFIDPSTYNPKGVQKIKYHSLQGDATLYYNPAAHFAGTKKFKSFVYGGVGYAFNTSDIDSNRKEHYLFIKGGFQPTYYYNDYFGFFADLGLMVTSERYIGCYHDNNLVGVNIGAGVLFRF